MGNETVAELARGGSSRSFVEVSLPSGSQIMKSIGYTKNLNKTTRIKTAKTVLRRTKA